ncbi:MAG TPA: hypothetical protein VJ385_13935 [Fibrobacteria bacterium]|nr:hypothetical protein [Fibrobacteria bacterium]
METLHGVYSAMRMKYQMKSSTLWNMADIQKGYGTHIITEKKRQSPGNTAPRDLVPPWNDGSVREILDARKAINASGFFHPGRENQAG